MRKVVRRSLVVIGLLVIAVLLFAAWKIWVLLYGTPAKVDTMATRQFVQYLREDPETLTLLGFVDGGRLDFHSDELTDRSVEHRDEMKRLIRDFRDQLDRYDPEALPADQRLTWDVWSWWLDTEIAATEPFFGTVMAGPYVVNQFGLQAAVPDLLVKKHSLRNEKLARNYVRRLEAVGDAVEQTIRAFGEDADRGMIPPRFILERVIDDIEALIASPADQSPLVIDFRSRVTESGAVEGEALDELERRAVAAVQEIVNPGFTRLRDVLVDRLDEARIERPGLVGVPGGVEYYDALIRRYTTTDLSADELHEQGLREVARLEAQIAEEAERLGFGDLAVPENAARLSAESSYGLSDDEEGRTRLLEITESLIEEAKEASSGYFEQFPRADVEVRPIPDYAAASAPNSYTPPARDGSRPGYYNINASRPSSWGRAGLPTLTYHEAIPGHHYQVALAREIGIPILRANLPFPAYTEGWALYTETIAGEMGLYDENPVGRIGALRSELFRAIRLVVDTGLHARGWSRDEAADYLLSTMNVSGLHDEESHDEESDGANRSRAFSEIDRYVVLPGQALAYKVGQMQIARLRERAERELGEEFDIREFHSQVLSQGAMPLSILADRIEEWIDSRM